MLAVVVVRTVVVFGAVIAAVAVPIVGIQAIVAEAVAAVRRRIADLLLETPYPNLDVAALTRAQSKAADIAQAALDVASFGTKAIGLAVADRAAAVEPLDLALDLVDPGLKATNLAVIVVVVAVRIALRLRGILRGKVR